MSSLRVSELLKRRQEISNKLLYPPAKQPYISDFENKLRVLDKTSSVTVSLNQSVDLPIAPANTPPRNHNSFNGAQENGFTPTSSELDALVLSVDVSNFENANDPQPLASTPTSIDLDALIASVDVSSFVNLEEANPLTPTILHKPTEQTFHCNQFAVISPQAKEVIPLLPQPTSSASASKQVLPATSSGFGFCTGRGGNLNVPATVKKFRALFFDDPIDPKRENADIAHVVPASCNPTEPNLENADITHSVSSVTPTSNNTLVSSSNQPTPQREKADIAHSIPSIAFTSNNTVVSSANQPTSPSSPFTSVGVNQVETTSCPVLAHDSNSAHVESPPFPESAGSLMSRGSLPEAVPFRVRSTWLIPAIGHRRLLIQNLSQPLVPNGLPAEFHPGITFENAVSYRFPAQAECANPSDWNESGVEEEGALRIESAPDGTVGVEELRAAFERSDLPHKDRIPLSNEAPTDPSCDWLANHYRLVVWKLAALDFALPDALSHPYAPISLSSSGAIFSQATTIIRFAVRSLSRTCPRSFFIVMTLRHLRRNGNAITVSLFANSSNYSYVYFI